jgi:hypothetical protein
MVVVVVSRDGGLVAVVRWLEAPWPCVVRAAAGPPAADTSDTETTMAATCATRRPFTGVPSFRGSCAVALRPRTTVTRGLLGASDAVWQARYRL